MIGVISDYLKHATANFEKPFSASDQPCSRSQIHRSLIWLATPGESLSCGNSQIRQNAGNIPLNTNMTSVKLRKTSDQCKEIQVLNDHSGTQLL